MIDLGWKTGIRGIKVEELLREIITIERQSKAKVKQNEFHHNRKEKQKQEEIRNERIKKAQKKERTCREKEIKKREEENEKEIDDFIETCYNYFLKKQQEEKEKFERFKKIEEKKRIQHARNEKICGEIFKEIIEKAVRMAEEEKERKYKEGHNLIMKRKRNGKRKYRNRSWK